MNAESAERTLLLQADTALFEKSYTFVLTSDNLQTPLVFFEMAAEQKAPRVDYLTARISSEWFGIVTAATIMNFPP